MAYLNAQERESLRRELMGMRYGQARGRLLSMDRKARLRYYRNAQVTGEHRTMYVLPERGVQVILVEETMTSPGILPGTQRTRFGITDVIVEPLPANVT